MNIELIYICPVCGCTWNEAFECVVSGACRCPSCEEDVLPSLKSQITA